MAKKKTGDENAPQEQQVVSPELAAALAKLTDTQKEVEELSSTCKQIVVKDEDSLRIAQQNLTKVNTLLKFVDERRKEIKEPFKKSCETIDEVAKGMTNPLSDAVTHLKAGIKSYDEMKVAEMQAAQKKLEEEAEARRKEEADRLAENEKITSYINVTLREWMQERYSENDVEKLKQNLNAIINNFPTDDRFKGFSQMAYELRDNYIQMIQTKIETLSKADVLSDQEKKILEDKRILAEQKEALAAREREIIAEEERIKSEKERKVIEEKAEQDRLLLEAKSAQEQTSGIRKNWKFELVDKSKLIPDWITIDESAVKEYLKANKEALKDGEVINGVKFYKETSVVA